MGDVNMAMTLEMLICRIPLVYEGQNAQAFLTSSPLFTSPIIKEAVTTHQNVIVFQDGRQKAAVWDGWRCCIAVCLK